jgi:hypothetical protein
MCIRNLQDILSFRGTKCIWCCIYCYYNKKTFSVIISPVITGELINENVYMYVFRNFFFKLFDFKKLNLELFSTSNSENFVVALPSNDVSQQLFTGEKTNNILF